MLGTDTHDAAETTAKLLSDPRVTRMWDPTRRAGYWFYSNVLSNMPDMKDREVYGRGITWDTFLVYGASADWPKGKAPDAPLAAGATVMADHELLGRQVDALLQKSDAKGEP